jgi:hypothetical protein
LESFDAKKDYYAIIGAHENDSARELERLYKQQAHKRHPDRGGSDEDMKILNEAYRVLRDEQSRKEYDSHRRSTVTRASIPNAAPIARDVGVHGQLLSALLCGVLGLMLLFLVRFNGLWFLWPLSILAVGVMGFGVLIAHSAMTNARESLAPAHPVRRLRAIQEIGFWAIVCGGGFGVYVILTWM